MRNAGLEEAQAGIKIAGRNINNLRYAHDNTLMAESEEELKSLLMKMKVESEKVGSQAPLPMGFSRQEYWSGVPLPLLKLKLQYFGHLMQRVDSLEKTDPGRDWGQEEKGMTEDEMAGWHD